MTSSFELEFSIMGRRLPAQPPVLPGYTYLRALGVGGFADVYLYEQALPRRQVAVKVLLPGVSDEAMRRMFLVETTLMAQLSSHPAVLTVYEANVASDGRPYLVMEHCPTGYGDRFRAENLSLDEVLATAIATGGVLETAHRSGILHRDIKPANILTTAYGKPVVADFGIASTVAQAEGMQAVGLSIPWSAPEIVSGETTGTIRSEVWAFAATVYALLAGRSPFEIPGKDNSSDAIAKRILSRERVARIERNDIPEELQLALARGLSKNPDARPESVLDLLRTLQLVESGLGLRPSPVDILQSRAIDSESFEREARGDDSALERRNDPTRRARTTRVRKDSRRGETTGSASAFSESDAAQTVLRAAPVPQPRRPTRLLIGLGMLSVVLIGGAAVYLATSRGSDEIPMVTGIESAVTADSISFAWPAETLTDDDEFLVRIDGGSGIRQRAGTLDLARSEYPRRVCITVTVVRNGSNGPVSRAACARGSE
ncbi:serine/threonine protein kinase [Mycetocola sp. BIGb0189]|uniref:serine/threonine-protein kinase n=1 Tax=Mycetocola sp. BIGb0189 TaxID=2940604 RepID=UPI002169724D|nr:serine/threonine-protein kinase [Mycetocola sp. BIGb0189]MCS4276676.1 serine/threonine protein kinase [Mycetocola sp. BIGb0189]